MRLSRRAVLAAVAGSAAGPFLAAPVQAQNEDRPPVFETARHQFIIVRPSKLLPAITLTDINGRAAPVAPVPGKVLLINIWATWCEACRADLPLLERFHNEASHQANVIAVSIDRSERRQITDYLRKLTIRSLPVYLDPDGKLAGNPASSVPLPVYGMPLTYLITPSGRIAGYMAGVADWLAPDAQELLAYYAAA